MKGCGGEAGSSKVIGSAARGGAGNIFGGNENARRSLERVEERCFRKSLPGSRLHWLGAWPREAVQLLRLVALEGQKRCDMERFPLRQVRRVQLRRLRPTRGQLRRLADSPHGCGDDAGT